ncbi:hypothetical protein [Streptococcus parauberis]|uniref:hypothetical protein n=1 Tax=Streptococcus parauberis TaxID=1348 RepID=UPI0039B08408
MTDEVTYKLLIRKGGKDIQVVDNFLTCEDEKIILYLNDIIQKYNKLKNFYVIFCQEFKAIDSYYSEMKTINNEINRLVINFATNTNLFLDFLEVQVRKEFPDKYSIWKKRQSQFYDNNFEYRFMYHLRNHVQHVGLPIGGYVVAQSEKDEKKIDYYVNYNQVVADRQFYNKVRDQLNKYVSNGKISIMPMVNKYSGIVQLVYKSTIELFVDKYLKQLLDIKVHLVKNHIIGEILKTKQFNFVNISSLSFTGEKVLTALDVDLLLIDFESLGLI